MLSYSSLRLDGKGAGDLATGIVVSSVDSYIAAGHNLIAKGALLR